MAGEAGTGVVDHDRAELLGVLTCHRVAFVLIGGAAIQSHGRRFDTQDIDLAPDTTPENLARLADALNELDCRLITDAADPSSWVALPADYFTPRTLKQAGIWNLATRCGQLDLTFSPAGFPGGFGELVSRAAERPVAGTAIAVMVAALEDVHESKRQADRPKDREYLRAFERRDRPHDDGMS
jgi:hypothetical protein